MALERLSTKKVLNIDISEDDDLTQEYLDLREFSGGIVYMPAAWTAASIGFKVAAEPDETPLPLYDQDAALVQIDSAVANQAFEIPPDIFGCRYVWLWSQNGSGTNTAQAADRELIVMLKS